MKHYLQVYINIILTCPEHDIKLLTYAIWHNCNPDFSHLIIDTCPGHDIKLLIYVLFYSSHVIIDSNEF